MPEWEEKHQEKLSRLKRQAEHAQHLLDDPHIKKFIDGEKEKAWNEFKRLSTDADREDFVSIKIKFDLIDKFEKSLQNLIQNFKDEQQRGENLNLK